MNWQNTVNRKIIHFLRNQKLGPAVNQIGDWMHEILRKKKTFYTQ